MSFVVFFCCVLLLPLSVDNTKTTKLKFYEHRQKPNPLQDKALTLAEDVLSQALESCKSISIIALLNSTFICLCG